MLLINFPLQKRQFELKISELCTKSWFIKKDHYLYTVKIKYKNVFTHE
jgi:hypothetical protein